MLRGVGGSKTAILVLIELDGLWDLFLLIRSLERSLLGICVDQFHAVCSHVFLFFFPFVRHAQLFLLWAFVLLLITNPASLLRLRSVLRHSTTAFNVFL